MASRPAGRYLASWPAGWSRNSRPGCPRCLILAVTSLEDSNVIPKTQKGPSEALFAFLRPSGISIFVGDRRVLVKKPDEEHFEARSRKFMAVGETGRCGLTDNEQNRQIRSLPGRSTYKGFGFQILTHLHMLMLMFFS